MVIKSLIVSIRGMPLADRHTFELWFLDIKLNLKTENYWRNVFRRI